MELSAWAICNAMAKVGDRPWLCGMTMRRKEVERDVTLCYLSMISSYGVCAHSECCELNLIYNDYHKRKYVMDNTIIRAIDIETVWFRQQTVSAVTYLSCVAPLLWVSCAHCARFGQCHMSYEMCMYDTILSCYDKIVSNVHARPWHYSARRCKPLYSRWPCRIIIIIMLLLRRNP